MKKARDCIEINIAIYLVQSNTLTGQEGVTCDWVREMEFASCEGVI